jgi:hypothetical protein
MAEEEPAMLATVVAVASETHQQAPLVAAAMGSMAAPEAAAAMATSSSTLQM